MMVKQGGARVNNPIQITRKLNSIVAKIRREIAHTEVQLHTLNSMTDRITEAGKRYPEAWVAIELLARSYIEVVAEKHGRRLTDDESRSAMTALLAELMATVTRAWNTEVTMGDE